MKVKIISSDRIGITHEILAAFSAKAWNLKAVEVEIGNTYVYIGNDGIDLKEVIEALKHLTDIVGCQSIDLMPTEVRENHLQALLARIPDPIIDLDTQGKVLSTNKAAQDLLDQSHEALEGKYITEIIPDAAIDLNNFHEYSISVEVLGSPFIADVTPVINNNSLSGLVITLRSILKLGRQISVIQRTGEQAIGQIVGKSGVLKQVVAQTLRFAHLDLPVLITGETGTGKELIAKALHQSSERKSAPFLTLNCAALPEQLLESELFGYEAGAFTGASKGGKPGIIELADGGTIFLDEIAEMSVYLQAKLLRFLQDYTYRRVGGSKELRANVKVISASHQDFTNLIENKLFREDLFYRLNVLSLTLPALRERAEDIPLLVDHFLTKAAKQVNAPRPSMGSKVMDMLIHNSWPGNIRQLENVIFRLVALAESTIITYEEACALLDENAEKVVSNESNVEDWQQAQQQFEKALLEKMFPLYPSTRKLADRLKVSHNKIAMKLRAYKIGKN